jgi:hypothetical protein
MFLGVQTLVWVFAKPSRFGTKFFWATISRSFVPTKCTKGRDSDNVTLSNQKSTRKYYVKFQS